MAVHLPSAVFLFLPALPGSPNNILSISDITKFVLTDVATLYDSGITNVVIENLGDVPYYKYNTRSHLASFMTKIGLETPKSKLAHSIQEAWQIQEEIGFPIIIRPSFTLGGTGGEVQVMYAP